MASQFNVKTKQKKWLFNPVLIKSWDHSMTSLSNYFHMVGKHTVLHKSVKKKKSMLNVSWLYKLNKRKNLNMTYRNAMRWCNHTSTVYIKKKNWHKYRYMSLHARVMFVFNSCEGHGFIRTTAFFAVTLYTYRWCRKWDLQPLSCLQCFPENFWKLPQRKIMDTNGLNLFFLSRIYLITP